MLKTGMKLLQKTKKFSPLININAFSDLNLLYLIPPLPKKTRPVQKYILEAISYMNLPFYENAINQEFISKLHTKMEPGDIIFTRANWHMNNLGIPGFWKHNILFTGDLEKIDKYFNEDLNINASQIIKEKYPVIHRIMNNETLENPISIIEVKRAGVIIRSFEEAGEVDYLAIIRPRITKQEKFKAILSSMEHYSKPYDHDFDAKNDDALTCSELIYRAYKNSLTLELKQINGRTIITPDSIYKKFIDEMNSNKQELDFIFSVNLDKNNILDEDIQKFVNLPKSII